MRPHVTVQVISSVDGRTEAGRWSAFEGRGEHEAIRGLLGGGAWTCGRVTTGGDARGEAPCPESGETLPRADLVARRDAASSAVALDASGRLARGRDAIDGDHLIVVLGDAVPDSHLAGLRRDGVSDVFGGPGDMTSAACWKR